MVSVRPANEDEFATATPFENDGKDKYITPPLLGAL